MNCFFLKKSWLCFYITVILWLPIYWSPVLAQLNSVTPPKIIAPSPDAAALGKYGEIPVGLYTGIPSVSIPIYEVKQGKISVPISLSYNGGGGIKVQEESGWAGLGWVLNAGGIITRTLREKDDLHNSQYFNSAYPIVDFNGGISNPRCRLDAEPTPAGTNGIFYGYFSSSNAESLYEFQPDIFYFNFLNYSGKFIIDQSEGFHIIGKDENIKIEFINNAADQKVNGFIITLPDGLKCTFTPTAVTQQTSSGNNTYISSWNLKKIESPIGDSVRFNYGYENKTSFYRRSLINASNISFQAAFCPPIGNAFSTYVDDIANMRKICEGSTYGIISDSYSTNDITENLLSSIEFSNGRVDFLASPTRQDLWYGSNIANAYKLDSIEVKNNSGLLVKKNTFEYSYFESNSYPVFNSNLVFVNNRIDKKLRLIKCTETGKPPHLFEYNNDAKMSIKSWGGDEWGLNNKLRIGMDKVYLGDDITLMQNTARDAEAYTNRSGILEKITYPTGGYTKLVYETHTFNEFAQSNLQNDVSTYEVMFDNYTGQNINDNNKSFVIDGGYSGKVLVELRFEYRLTTEPCQFFSSYPQCGIFLQNMLKNFSVNIGGKVLAFGGSFYQDGSPISMSGQYQPNIFLLSFEPGAKLISFNIPNTQPVPGVQFRLYARVKYEKTKYGGGLRIKSTEDYTPGVTNTPITKNYIYADQVTLPDNTVLNQKPFGKILSPVYTRKREYKKSMDISCNCERTETYSESIIPLGSSGGGAVGYDSVIVQYDGNQSLGKTVTAFINLPEQILGFNYPNLPNISNPSNGNILAEKKYNNNARLASDINYEYETKKRDIRYGNIIERDQFALKFNELKAKWCGSLQSQLPCPTGAFYIHTYKMYTDWVVAKKTTERIYNQDAAVDAFVETVTDYDYANSLHKLPTKITTTNSKGEVNTHLRLYPADYAGNTGFIGQLKNKFMHNQLIESVQMRNKSNTDYIVSGLVNTFKNTSQGLPDLVKTLELNNIMPLSAFKFSNQTTAGILPSTLPNTGFAEDPNYNTQLTYNLYNSNGNLLQYMAKDGIINSFVWGYNQNYPIVKVSGASYADILTALSQTDINLAYLQALTGNALNVELSKIRTYLSTNRPMAEVYSYTYLPLIGMLSETNSNSRNKYYEYDSFNRLKLIRDHDNNILKSFDYQYQQPQ